MIEDENHPEMTRAAKDLAQQVLSKLSGKELTGSMLDSLKGDLGAHRSKWLLRGVAFPVMTLFVLPRLGRIELFRADLDRSAIQLQMINMTRKYPDVTAIELAVALRYAWPDYKPDLPDTVH